MILDMESVTPNPNIRYQIFHQQLYFEAVPYLHVVLVNTLCGLQLSFLQIQTSSLSLGLVRYWRQPVVEAAHYRNMSENIRW